MVTFGLDVSHHQAASLDLARCRREGIEFVFMKSSEGSTFVDPAFTTNLNEARAAGLLVAAYHYVRSNATAAAQVANVRRIVPRDVPVIPDVEANSGGVALVREFVRLLVAAGYTVPFTYLPRWYWQQIGAPSLAGLPPLWSSRYPDNVVGSIADEWADVPASYWVGYGNLPVAVLQFTSSASIAGHQPIDANAYPGTRTQLAVALGHAATEEGPMFQSIELPPTAAEEPREVVVALPWQGGDGGVTKVWGMLVAGAGGLQVNVAHWRYVDSAGNVAGATLVPDGLDLPPFSRSGGELCPVQAHALIVNYSAPDGAALVIEAK